MDYFGGKLVPGERRFGGAEQCNWEAADPFRTLRAKVNALHAWSAAVRDDMALPVPGEPRECGVKEKMGNFGTRAVSESRGFAGKTWGMRFWAVTDGFD